MIGQSISQYRILEKLGEGGMGVVYKAQDTKLDRFVALKFLPAHMAASEQDKVRFAQEAKSAAALNHPNVCSIIDIQEIDNQMFIVMEFVDGVTLLEKKSSLTQKQAIDVAIQIAEGLAAAHEKGIVHRDIKPENVMVRKNGIVQVMDFGLAKLVGASRLTKAGNTVGTLGYMSPEQVQGQETDHRSDIFSFGVLLYEMLTGRSPFNGTHESAILYEVVNVDVPPPSTLKPGLDPELDRIVLECMEKDPNERMQSIKQAAIDLNRFKRTSSRSRASRTFSTNAMSNVNHNAGSNSFPSSFRISGVVPYTAAIVFFITTVIISYLYLFPKATSQPLIRSSILFPDTSLVIDGGMLALSPDGTKLAFIGEDPRGVRKIWVRTLSTFSAIELPGTEKALFPFWSPDSRYIGFFAEKSMKRTDAHGGGLLTLCEWDTPFGATWSEDGSIYFCSWQKRGILRVPSQGGAVTTIVPAQKGEVLTYPHMLDDAKTILYNRFVASKDSSFMDGVYAYSFGSNDSRLLVPNAVNAQYANGYLLSIQEKVLFAQPFDPVAVEVQGEANIVAQQVAGIGNYGKSNYSVSQNGLLVYAAGSSYDNAVIQILDRSGKGIKQFDTKSSFDDPKFSDDGSKIAVTRYINQERADIWIIDVARGTMSRFTFDDAEEDDPVWSHDGNAMIYAMRGDIVRKSFVSNGKNEVLYQSTGDMVPYDLSLDGKFLLFADLSSNSQRDIFMLPLEGKRDPIIIAGTDFSEMNAEFSPDGKWIVFSSNETGRSEVYALASDLKSPKVQISTSGGVMPHWTKFGKNIMYVDPDQNLFEVPVSMKNGNLEAGNPVKLFHSDIEGNPARSIYDVTPDGNKIAIIKLLDNKQLLKPINLVTNWNTELQKQ